MTGPPHDARATTTNQFQASFRTERELDAFDRREPGDLPVLTSKGQPDGVIGTIVIRSGTT